MAPKTLCETTCEITVAQQSTELSRAKYAALQQRNICPSTREEPYTKLSMKHTDIQVWPESEPASSQGLLPRWTAQLQLSQHASPLAFQS